MLWLFHSSSDLRIIKKKLRTSKFIWCLNSSKTSIYFIQRSFHDQALLSSKNKYILYPTSTTHGCILALEHSIVRFPGTVFEEFLPFYTYLHHNTRNEYTSHPYYVQFVCFHNGFPLDPDKRVLSIAKKWSNDYVDDLWTELFTVPNDFHWMNAHFAKRLTNRNLILGTIKTGLNNGHAKDKRMHKMWINGSTDG